MLSERYRLEIHWDSVSYDRDGICFFKNAYFSGPVLSNMLALQPNDSIMLDFYKQYFVLVPKPFIGKFSWGEVIHTEGKIFLKDARLEHADLLNKVPTLNNNDYMVIDTEEHEEATHRFNLFYKTFIVKDTGDEYNFRDK